MFNKEFYPTPDWLIDKMLEDINFKKVKYVLEPSAGKGDIIKAIRKKEKTLINHTKAIDIDAIEIDENLIALLKGKKYKVIYDDFLTFETYKKYNLIIMNPPFSEGDKHLLKAIEIQKNGGDIVCLLNAETIKNPYSNTRKDLYKKLKELDASIEFIENSFINAENKTDIEVALIKIHIKAFKKKSIIIENLKQEEKVNDKEKIEFKGLIVDDFVKQIVDRYNLEIQAGIKLIKEYRAIKPYLLRDINKTQVTMLKLVLNQYGNNESVKINDFIESVREKYWKALFSDRKFVGHLTSNLQNDYYRQIDKLKNYDFSIYNIYSIRCDIHNSMINGIEDTILKLFEELSNKYHYYDETSRNIHYYNGWKTNKSWIINKKVIIPLRGFRRWTYDHLYLSYDIERTLEDIEKVFNYLDAQNTKNVSIQKTLNEAFERAQSRNIKLKFFNVTFYKKGTCHIEFTNLDLLKKFNIFGSQRKNWLPPTYGKVKYNDMSDEERKVIDEFEGKESYEQTMSNTDYFIVKKNKLLELQEKSI